ncbi:cytochrome P450 [Mycobacterium stomatepiae]|uniref:Putative cytochrome P450 138 n=1 Tax=Mycobacterium stomatepiae TaxID=470076 RepID=A0A7I7QBM2_9MYCO|nr:cytochrome P450 [Mycobacterium stomatepiae]MCV7164096.1 cytochrome P450 [Mycobacterium stomatepiae]BBY23427.1 putative cytochrome P450 138 [Mycobacterium stomatepiae]
MSEVVTAAAPASVVRLPPTARIPKLLQGFGFAMSRRSMMQRLSRRYGNVFALKLPMWGHVVMVSDPQLAKQIFTTSPDELGNIQPNLSRLFGYGSVFGLEGDDHRCRRRLLAPPFHGKSIKNYESIIEEETLRESAGWPQDESFATLAPMMRITLNAILRAVFGADGAELDELRRLIPPWVTLGSRLAALPKPKRDYGRFSPWHRLDEWRRQYDNVIEKLIAAERADPNFTDRADVLALLLRSTYEDGSAMSYKEIGDELLALLAAGHETTASTLAWAFERISRHPQLLAQLVEEADGTGEGDGELRQATILEVQRARTVIDFAGRHVYPETYRLGEWVIPRGYSIIVGIAQIHDNPDVFADPGRFDPQRFIANKPSALSWIPFGGGTRRCVGAAFANMEMDVVLRTVLRHFTIETTNAPDEPWHSRGVAFTPKRGGRVVLRRR